MKPVNYILNVCLLCILWACADDVIGPGTHEAGEAGMEEVSLSLSVRPARVIRSEERRVGKECRL